MADALTSLSSTTFLATIPDIQSAIKFGGDGSVRIQFDVPEVEMAGVMPLTIWTRRVLRITVEPEMQVGTGEPTGHMAAGRDRQPKRQTAKESRADNAPRTRWLKVADSSGQED